VKVALKKGYDTSKVFVSLAAAKGFKIHVLGEVVNPGAKTTLSFARVDEAIIQAGGFSSNAVRDHIRILRQKGEPSDVDLAAYFEGYLDQDNPHLNIGDKLVVSPIDHTAPLAVIRYNNETYFHHADGKYDLKHIFLQINSYAVNELPPRVRVTGPGGKVISMEMSQAMKYSPAAGDTIEYFKELQNVFVGGAVQRPSVYAYVPQFRAQDYLFLAGILPNSQNSDTYVVLRNGAVLPSSTVEETGIKPGDKIRIDRSRVESSRDYLSIIASLAGIVLSAATLYYTARAN
jgi:protein involved in polysaccharide export with SLBB domain